MSEIDQTKKNQFVAMVESSLKTELDKLPDRNHHILIAISGGPDSTALATALGQLASGCGWQLSACHVNHGLRGLESDLDQEFCEKLCLDLGIDFAAYKLSVKPEQVSEACYSADLIDCEEGALHASENSLRELRYDLLLKHAKKIGAQVIVTGHTLDDQTETLLFRLFRGTSPSGLKGMEGQRELIEGEGVFLIRPLLSLTKADCQRFLAIEQIGAHFDSSNDDPKYSRNFLRLQVIPALDDRFPGWKLRLENLRTVISEQEDLFDSITQEALEKLTSEDSRGQYFAIEEFEKLHIALRRRIIASFLAEKQVEPSFERIDKILSLACNSSLPMLNLSQDWQVKNDDGKLRWLKMEEEDEVPSPFLMAQETIIHLPQDGKKTRSNLVSWLNKSVRVEEWDDDSPVLKFPRESSAEVFVDLSRVLQPLTIRLRRPGDVIQPFGMSETVRLKKYLHTHKREETSMNLPHTVVLCNDDEVLWVPGVGLSEKLRVKGKPTHRLAFQDLSFSSDSSWA